MCYPIPQMLVNVFLQLEAVLLKIHELAHMVDKSPMTCRAKIFAD